jgi:hypothetical protein
LELFGVGSSGAGVLLFCSEAEGYVGEVQLPFFKITISPGNYMFLKISALLFSASRTYFVHCRVIDKIKIRK